MTTPSSPPDPAAQRILTHMNTDHRDSLTRYLEHYHSLSSFSARSATLTETTKTYMLITTSPHSRPTKGPKGPSYATCYRIPFAPPLQSWSEARERVVNMDAECIRALRREDVTLKHYIPPTNFDLVVTITCALTFLLLHRRANLDPAAAPSWVKPVLERFPATAQFLWNVQPKAFWPMVVVHAGEAGYIHFSRLRGLSVATGSGVWWKWVLSTFLGGFGNFQRVDAWVKREKARKEKQKH